LLIDERGFPIPKFVPYVDGKPDFRGMEPNHLRDCIKKKLCWLCGEPLGVHMTFVIGPMCAINRNSSEPPSHHDCAEYSTKACPFLTQPKMRRNEKGLTEDPQVAGIMIKRNPGVTMMWTTRSYKLMQAGGILFQIGDPETIECRAEGRKATMAEIMHSITTGIPILREHAKLDGPEAEKELEKMILHGIALITRMAT
jgi:hypothetical protein